MPVGRVLRMMAYTRRLRPNPGGEVLNKYLYGRRLSLEVQPLTRRDNVLYL